MPLALSVAANRIVPVGFVFWLGDHLDLLDQDRPRIRSRKTTPK
jgi:hypothetical protein